MKLVEKGLLVLGILLAAYACFSRIYGEPSIAMCRFKSCNILLAANTILVLATFMAVRNK